MKHSSWCLVAPILIGACGADPGGFDDPTMLETGDTVSPIIDGITTPNSARPILGAVKLTWASKPGSFCSGSLITNRVFITANHCVTGLNANPTVTFETTSATSQSRSVGTLVSHPSKDFAIGRLTTPFSINGSFNGFSRSGPISPPQTDDLAWCFGYGVNQEGFSSEDGDIPEDFGAGTLRHGLFRVEVGTPNIFGQPDPLLYMHPHLYNGTLYRNDSGAPCINAQGELIYVHTGHRTQPLPVHGKGVDLYQEAAWVYLTALALS